MTLEEAYDTLGVPINSDLKTAQASFRKLALKYHPDREGGSDKKMMEINNAMNIIKNPEMATPSEDKQFNSRNFAESFAERNKTAQTRRPTQRYNENFDTSDFLNEFFSGDTTSTTRVRGRNRISEEQNPVLVIALKEQDLKEEVLEKTFKLKTGCKGSKICPSCRGNGKTLSSFEANTIYGTQTSYRVIHCVRCKGTGSLGTCFYCSNRQPHIETYHLKVPLREVVGHIGETILGNLNTKGGSEEKKMTFNLEELPFSFYVKLNSKDIETRIKNNEKISFKFIGEKKTYSLSDLMTGKAYEMINNTKIYFRLTIKA